MSYFPRNGDLRGSDRWDSASRAWVPAAEWQERQWAREDAAFARRANQGELQCPQVIFDSMRSVQSQVDGRHYDSKSAIRRHYKQSGVIEVGNETSTSRWWGGKPAQDPHADRGREAAMRKFHQHLDIGGEPITKIVHDEDGMKRLRHQGKA